MRYLNLILQNLSFKMVKFQVKVTKETSTIG